MKALRNPWVTGGLVIAAVAVVGYQFFPSLSQAFQTPIRPAPVAPAPAAPAAPIRAEAEAPRPAEPAAAKPILPQQAIDTNYGPTHMAEWIEAPRRDPFFLIPTVQSKAVHVYPSPVLKWKLKAIWRQTGGRVAAINNGVYSEGDSIDGYRIEKIDGDQIWVQGPDRLERLGFDKVDPSAVAGKTQPRS